MSQQSVDLDGAASQRVPDTLNEAGKEAILRIPVTLKIVLGSVRLPVAKLLKLSRGAILPLNRKVGEPVDIVVNDRLIARGEVIVLDETGSQFAVSVTEVVRASE